MNKINIALGVALVAIVIAIGSHFVGSTPVQQTIVGGAAGPTKTEYQEFLGGGTFGRTNSTTTNSTAGGTTILLTAADIAYYDQVLFTPTQATTTVTFPASSTLAYWLPKAGMRQDQCWVNATTSKSAGIIFAAGTGIDIENATTSSTAAGAPNYLTINGQDMACFRWVRSKADAGTFDLHAALTIYRDAD